MVIAELLQEQPVLEKATGNSYIGYMVNTKRLFAVSLLGFLAASGLGAQGRFRNITALSFDYYSDRRYGLIWEEVLISPLPKNLFLVTAAKGANGSESEVAGGRVGLAFDLPGAYYGEASYSLDYDWGVSSATHTVMLSGNYESGDALAGLSLSGNFNESDAGAVVSPSLRYAVKAPLALQGKAFIAFQRYDPGDAYFNVAFLASGEYALAPQIFLSAGGTFGTVYEPEADYEKWSLLGGLRVTPSPSLAVKTQFEYTNGRSHPTNPHEIFTTTVLLDFRFPNRR